ncbi:restriction endonuclease subunit S [Vibrio owensii]|uniref:restriction endonuclease subunit S n=1 Tax=Vibrio owensii TaxID=696485 RepID=UPI0033918F30
MVPKCFTPLNDFVSKNAPICYGILKPGNHISDGVPVVKVKNIHGGKVDIDGLLKTSQEIHKQYKRAELATGDVLLTIRGTTGRVAITPPELNGANITQDTARIRVSTDDCTTYIFYALQAPQTQWQIELNTVGQAVKGINIAEVKKLNIYHPPQKEQRKIAQILSTWDRGIATTEKLINASKQQKKALMQQLLTGKKRLIDPETGKAFEGGWEDVKLGEISYITTGNSNREDSSLDAEYTFFDRSEDIRKSSRYLFDSEAVIVAGEGQDFIPKYFKGKFDLHQRTYAIMNFEKSVGKFLYYYIGFTRHYFLSQAVGSTVKSLRLPMFQKMPIQLPSKDEQQKIASVLTAADKEIELLVAKLAHLKQEKKALMQQLLTGKRRVKVAETEAA